MIVGLEKRTRLSLVGVWAVFFFIFSGLFCGFLIAHFFPEQVIRLIYGVSTDAPARAPAEPGVAAEETSTAGESVVAGSGRERDLSESLRLQSAMDAAGPIALAEEVADTPPSFAKRRKPSPPAAVLSAPAGHATSSFLPAAQYPAAEWRKLDAHAGFVDAAVIASTGGKLGNVMPKLTDFIELSGWSGDPALGMRFKDVLFGMCGKIVGHAKIGSPRPDVAKTVHPNLEPSGWRGRLYVAYLPYCPNAAIQVLGAIPGSSTVVPVGDPVPVRLPLAEKRSGNDPPGALVFTPKSVVPAKFISIEVTDTADLRRCGAGECAIVGQIAKGRYQGYIAEEKADGWVLLILADKAGWLSRSQLTWAR